MRFRRIPGPTLAKVVVFGLVSAVFTVGLAVKIGNIRLFSDAYTLEAEFAEASGVFRGDAVKLAGVEVGRVERARIEEGRAIVTFTVDPDVRLTTESRVGLRWRNVLGQRFLYLYPGDGGGRPLEDGDRVPITHTEAAGDIGEFLNSLGPILRAIDPDKANAFLDAVNTALAGNEATVRALIDDGAVLAVELAAMDREIQSLIASSDRILAAYASQDDAIGAIVENLDRVGASLEGMTDDVNTLIENFAVVQRELDRILRENRGNIDISLRDLQAVAETLARNRTALAQTLCTLPAGVAPYFATTSWGEWFNVRIVEFILRDPEGATVARQSELPNQQAPLAPAVFTGCGGETYRTPASAAPAPATALQSPDGPTLLPSSPLGGHRV